MASLEELRSERIKKLESLKKAGIDPYPIETHITHTLAEADRSFAALKRKKTLTLGGRITALRGQGALMFADLTDGTGGFQAVFKKDEMDAEEFDRFAAHVDIGDIIETEGSLFVTKSGQKSILAASWRMLAKSIRPLPGGWHGFEDQEERYRRRYLDTLINAEAKERFITRSRIIALLRSELDKKGFLEVETPMLHHHAGGAAALPFKTHHNALDIPLYMRIAPELYLKKLLIGGFPKIYELGRNFRNEGIDATHSPEFTMLELYESYSDAKGEMAIIESLFKTLAKKFAKNGKVSYGGNKVDFSEKFVAVPYHDLLEKYAGLAVNVSRNEAARKAEELNVPVAAGDTEPKILDNIFKKACRPHIIAPTFVVDYPADYLPLAKRKEGDKTLVDAFQLVAGGLELAKGFSELNDPVDQAARFAKEDENQKKGAAEAQTSDTEFLEALEYGMPPAGGVGIGIERVVMLFTDAHNIRDVILFPTLRPRKQKD